MAAPRFVPITGAIAQLGERVLCKHEVVGSIPSGSTISNLRSKLEMVPSAPRDSAVRRTRPMTSTSMTAEKIKQLRRAGQLAFRRL
jgi:hypothetical protein